VYVGGFFTNAGGAVGADYIARWDGAAWQVVGGAGALDAPVYALAISSDDLYVGGAFYDAGGNRFADKIARTFATLRVYLPLVVR
ncbi:MAG: hypothetical protein ACUVSW_16070, partial [Roseiflexus sp.]